jgi:hypothetical protein
MCKQGFEAAVNKRWANGYRIAARAATVAPSTTAMSTKRITKAPDVGVVSVGDSPISAWIRQRAPWGVPSSPRDLDGSERQAVQISGFAQQARLWRNMSRRHPPRWSLDPAPPGHVFRPTSDQSAC